MLNVPKSGLRCGIKSISGGYTMCRTVLKSEPDYLLVTASPPDGLPITGFGILFTSRIDPLVRYPHMLI